MLIWLLKDGENLPMQTNSRGMRTYMLADALVSRGHNVVWWSSTFSHQRKTLLYEYDIEVEVKPHFNLKLIYAGKYDKNISYLRYCHHRQLSTKFYKQAMQMPVPDIIVASFPIIDLAYEAVSYGNAKRIPVIIDIRDLWPDVFIDKTPKLLKGIANLALTNTYRKTRCLLSKANSIVAVSQGYLKWGLNNAGRYMTEADKIFYTGYDDLTITEEMESERINILKKDIKGKVVFTFIGSLGHSYEIELIGKVAKILLAQGKKNIVFVIAGEGEKSKLASNLASSFINIKFLGWLDKIEIYKLLRLSDVGLVPCLSVKDTLPNKPFEYMSAGLPILSSLEGEMESIIDDNKIGYSYKQGHSQALYELVLRLTYNEPIRKQMGQNARRLFERDFNSKIIYSNYAEHIEKIFTRKILING